MRTYILTCPSIYHQEASYAIRPPYAIPITVSISISIPFPELVAHTHFNTHGALHLEARTLNLLVQSVPRSTTYIHTPIHPYTLSYLHTCHPHTHTSSHTHHIPPPRLVVATRRVIHITTYPDLFIFKQGTQ